MNPPTPYLPGADRLDRLYDLLPTRIRARDQESGQPLRALLRVVAEQAAIVEDDIARLYENWFVETCDPWAVPYVAAVLGYRAPDLVVPGGAGGLDGVRGRRRLALLVPRRAAANALTHRRRKGTLGVLETLTRDLTGWTARAEEVGRRVARTPHLDRPREHPAAFVDLRDDVALLRGFGPFGTLPHTIDLRRAGSGPDGGRGESSDVRLTVWMGRAVRVAQAPAPCVQTHFDADTCRHNLTQHDYTFSVLGNRSPLISHPAFPPDPEHATTECDVPEPISLERFRLRPADYYGIGKSLVIWKDSPHNLPIPVADIVGTRLPRAVSLRAGQVAVDPERGLLAIVLPADDPPPKLWITYHFAAYGGVGAGGADREVPPRPGACHKLVRSRPAEGPSGQDAVTLEAALREWSGPKRPRHLVLDIMDDAMHTFPAGIRLGAGEQLEVRAGAGCRPCLELGDPNRDSGMHVGPATATEPGGILVLDGLLIAGKPLVLAGPLEMVRISHCTIVPGLGLIWDGTPAEANRPVLILKGRCGDVSIAGSIVGAVSVQPPDKRTGEPPALIITDSVLDNAAGPCPAIGSPGCAVAFVRLTMLRCTVFGPVEVHALGLAEDSLFTDPVRVARRSRGCVRYCLVPDGSDTPPRYRCQPDLVREVVPSVPARLVTQVAGAQALAQSEAPLGLIAPVVAATAVATFDALAQVVPRFCSRRYGHPDYALLSACSPAELRRGASDRSEMGAFHDEYFAQRQDNLRAGIDEFTPAGSRVEILYRPNCLGGVGPCSPT